MGLKVGLGVFDGHKDCVGLFEEETVVDMVLTKETLAVIVVHKVKVNKGLGEGVIEDIVEGEEAWDNDTVPLKVFAGLPEGRMEEDEVKWDDALLDAVLHTEDEKIGLVDELLEDERLLLGHEVVVEDTITLRV